MPSYHLITFGCQMNQHDSERIGDVLARAGYSESDTPDSADLVLLNTCSVREKAEQKLRSLVGRLGQLKEARPELIIAVAGCVAQQEGERLVKRMPQIDILIGPDNAALLPELLREVEGGAPPRVRTEFDLAAPRFLARARSGKRQVSAFVTIMKGCDERCTFCVVPTTRGPERYRPSDEILDEIQGLVESGTQEVTLLGQTVDSYRDPRGLLAGNTSVGLAAELGTLRGRRGDESEFPALLRAIAQAAPALRRLRYTSPHPRHLTPALVEAHRDLRVLARHVHMPVQSGSDRVLKRMLRRYSVAEYEQRVGALKDAVPGLTLSTDMIVGFPGESAEDFALTLELVERVGFLGVYGFKYSRRPGTPALKLEDDISDEEKSARLARLFELSESKLERHLASLVGSTQEVLVEGLDERGTVYSGRSAQNEIVHVDCAEDVIGRVLEVRIDAAYKHSLLATPLGATAVPHAERSARAPARALPMLR
jgi:tRNA-2-methylthio-N6-dimethylallyladenosine synthase